jgi:hypothetical protein
MNGPDVVVVELDDWAALYINGEKVQASEGHYLPLKQTINYILEQYGLPPVVFYSATPEFEDEVIMDIGRLPDTLPEPHQLC